MAPSVRQLLIVTHVVHYRWKGQIFAYGPYAREVDIWADLFPKVVLAAPCRDEAPVGDAVPFTRSNISVCPMMETGGDTLRAKVVQFLKLPALVSRLCRAMRRADAIHVRCPGNLGLLGVILAPLFSRYLIAKYAGQWNGYEGERPWVRLQRALLSSRWWRGLVTVYGKWPNQPSHVIPFFTSMMTDEQVAHAAAVAARKTLGSPLHVLFSGRLSPEKRVDALLEAVKIAIDQGVQLEVVLLGDGPERRALTEQAARLGIQDYVRFIGALPFDEALSWYEWGHCFVLPSVHSEGWPKVIAEGMCYGLLCVAVAFGRVPAMLTDRGILLKEGTPQEIADALQAVARDPAKFQPVMRDASLWARQHSLEGLRDALAELLADHWKLPPRSLSTAKAEPKPD